MRHYQIAVLAALAMAACAEAPTEVRPSVELHGQWLARPESGPVRTVIVDLEGENDALRGTVIGWLRDCASSCQVSGYVLYGHRIGDSVTFTLSFVEAPIGTDFAGSIGGDGTLSGAWTRVNTDLTRRPVNWVRP